MSLGFSVGTNWIIAGRRKKKGIAALVKPAVYSDGFLQEEKGAGANETDPGEGFAQDENPAGALTLSGRKRGPGAWLYRSSDP